jgi:hypothetical protein
MHLGLKIHGFYHVAVDVTVWKINSLILKTAIFELKLIFQPLSARVYVNLLQGKIFFWQTLVSQHRLAFFDAMFVYRDGSVVVIRE